MRRGGKEREQLGRSVNHDPELTHLKVWLQYELKRLHGKGEAVVCPKLREWAGIREKGLAQ